MIMMTVMTAREIVRVVGTKRRRRVTQPTPRTIMISTKSTCIAMGLNISVPNWRRSTTSTTSTRSPTRWQRTSTASSVTPRSEALFSRMSTTGHCRS
ncbi:hypothetical protein FOTG_19192 [Fusarium oxysporum f. sp. vasinfectum 25433]|uniref:Uncharacterized protein n=1 Tax=Fusarium oxysporum f. sp. vasinfectum 25433 TaxID=1089449 RepID=X0KU66_FUSOX|nr:hypothetical protein FOTG_19192 [Fusarium oxysporum f. sp. vasinfectum 25433]